MVKMIKSVTKFYKVLHMAINTSQLEVIVVEETLLWSTHRCGGDIVVEYTSLWSRHRCGTDFCVERTSVA